MSTRISSAEVVRRIELFALMIGMIVAFYILSLGAKSAFLSLLRSGLALQDVLLTAFSLVVMGAVVSSPFILLALLGKKLVGKGSVNRYQVAGLIISLLLTVLSVYLYMDAHRVVSTDRSSTAGLIFLAVPFYLCLLGGALYGLLNFLHGRSVGQAGRG
ncbi:MAG: hypothetical protein EP323_07955 [Gammaproteobacteria bacterium]|nr:MAG: hypothetical protein EP323_07955 [Gammaproteobacteria bacterium]